MEGRDIDRALGSTTHGSPPSEGEAVVARSVVKRFENGVIAVEDFDLRIRSGEFISIVGPSGCGKSTFLRLVAGLAPVTSGSVVLNGSEVKEPRQDVGMMFQKPTLLPWKTALENVVLPKVLAGEGKRADFDGRGRELLALVGLDGFEHAYPAHLSGGMQQRVALARLLIMGVDILLLDEPFAAVDELTRERLNMEFLQIHARIGATVILVTHSIGEAVFLADRVIVMSPRPGRIADTYEVGLPRPRTLEHMRSSEFQEVTYQVRKVLERFEVDAPEQAQAGS